MSNRRLEYVFGPPQPAFGHAIGVGALRMNYDTVLAPGSHGTLFSGGRDGRINAWSLQGDQAVSALVQTCHTNTVSALMPFSADTVVSCSTDTNVKLWNVKQNVVTKLGHHRDYVECLTHYSDTCVASGGLDDRVMGWDVASQKNAFELSVNHSVYTISSVRNSIIITGSPDGAVRIWDPRQRKQVMKLAGHTDSVRSILMSDDRDRMLSGSSDGTAVLWSLRYGRALKTMSQFDSSIWVLRPFGDGYLAGDRSGSLYMSHSLETEPEVKRPGLLPHGLKGLVYDEKEHNCWISTPFNPDIKNVDLDGQCQQVLKGHKGLKKHRLLNDKCRALVTDTDKMVHMVDLVGAKQLPFERQIPADKDVDSALDDILAEVNTMDVLDNWCQIEIKAGRIYVVLDRQSVNNTEVYLDDLTKYIQDDHAAAEKTPFASPLSSPLTSPVNSGFFKKSPAVSRVTSSQSLEYTLGSGKKRNSKLGSGHGKVNFYDPDDDGSSDDDDDEAKPKQKEEQKPSTIDENKVAHERATSGADADADGRPGQLKREVSALKIEEPARSGRRSESDAPRRLSESLIARSKSQTRGNNTIVPKSKSKPKLKLVEKEEPADDETADDELRINLGNFVLENLLRGVIDNLLKEYARTYGAEAANLRSRTTSASSHSQHHHAPAEPQPARPSPPPPAEKKHSKNFFGKIFGRNKAEKAAKPVHQPPPPDPHQEEMSAQRLKDQRHIKLLKEPDSKTFEEAWNRANRSHSFQTADPEAPITEIIGRDTRIIITEAEPGAGAPTEIYSTTVGALINNDLEDKKMMAVLPGWVGDAVLLGKLHLKKPTKIGFSITPVETGLPDFTNEDTRLTAIAMLRVRKIMAYIVGQLQKQKILTAAASSYQPEEIVKLTCNNAEIDPLTTLATVRTRIWPHGGDVSLNYSIRKRV